MNIELTNIDEKIPQRDLENHVIRILKSIGINLSPKLMQGGFINRFLTNPRFTFTEYNLKIIDDITNLKIESKKTQEFHESVILHQDSIDFFNNIDSEKSKEAISKINGKLTEIVEKLNPEFLRNLF